MRRTDYLFRETKSHDFVSDKQQSLKDKIDSESADCLNEVDYLQHIIKKYAIDAPTIHADKKQVVHEDTQITISIPFDGSPDLLNLTLPSTSFQSPKGTVLGNEIHLEYIISEQDRNRIKGEFENDIKKLEKCFTDLKSIIEEYNGTLEPIAKEAIAKRKAKFRADAQLIESLGIPLKKVNGGSPTFTIPLVRKKIAVAKPVVMNKNSMPSPTMIPDDYEAVLSLIKHLSLVIERNPHTFVSMEEPDIRNIILVILNAVYEGTATGETFNGSGKTDILLRHEGQNLFIAECKFWEGKKELTKAIDQLLGYITWRDTKTALIIFNRTKDFTSVLRKIQETVKEHKCYKLELPSTETAIFRYKFHRSDDAHQEFFLSVLVFEVPD